MFLLSMAVLMLKKKYFNKRQTLSAMQTPGINKQKTEIINDNILSDEDDLLKELDLSDLDNLDLDDFK